MKGRMDTGGFQIRPNRRSMRLKGYDYAQAGAYFVTICTQDRACLFGDVVDGEMRLNEAGWMVANTWEWLGNQYDMITLNWMNGWSCPTICMALS